MSNRTFWHEFLWSSFHVEEWSCSQRQHSIKQRGACDMAIEGSKASAVWISRKRRSTRTLAFLQTLLSKHWALPQLEALLYRAWRLLCLSRSPDVFCILLLLPHVLGDWLISMGSLTLWCPTNWVLSTRRRKKRRGQEGKQKINYVGAVFLKPFPWNHCRFYKSHSSCLIQLAWGGIRLRKDTFWLFYCDPSYLQKCMDA